MAIQEKQILTRASGIQKDWIASDHVFFEISKAAIIPIRFKIHNNARQFFPIEVQLSLKNAWLSSVFPLAFNSSRWDLLSPRIHEPSYYPEENRVSRTIDTRDAQNICAVKLYGCNLKVTVYDKNGIFAIFFFHKNKRFLGIFQFRKRNLTKD